MEEEEEDEEEEEEEDIVLTLLLLLAVLLQAPERERTTGSRTSEAVGDTLYKYHKYIVR